MTKAILHLGYPKTGTTYLQEKIFVQASNGMVVVSPTFENCGINIKSFKRQVSGGQVGADSRRKVLSRPLLLSIEGFVFDALRFVVGNSFCPADFPLALKGLKSLCSDLKPEDIAIVLCIRRQDQLIHSLYAESYTYQFQWVPEFDTFEKYVDAVMNPANSPQDPGYYFDFSRTIAEIRAQFPGSPIHIRSYENLVRNPEAEMTFWSEITGFEFTHIKTHANVRSAAPNTKVADKQGLRVHAVRLKTRYFSDLKLPNFLSRFMKQALSRMNVGEADKIELTDEMRKRLQAHFAPINEQFIRQESLLAPQYLAANVSVELQQIDWVRL